MDIRLTLEDLRQGVDPQDATLWDFRVPSSVIYMANRVVFEWDGNTRILKNRRNCDECKEK